MVARYVLSEIEQKLVAEANRKIAEAEKEQARLVSERNGMSTSIATINGLMEVNMPGSVRFDPDTMTMRRVPTASENSTFPTMHVHREGPVDNITQFRAKRKKPQVMVAKPV